MRNLFVDQVTVEVMLALRAARVGVILLKGPSIAGWIYKPGARSYVDIDLLIRPQDRVATTDVLTGLGFRTSTPPSLPLDRPTYHEWSRRPNEPQIDLHPTLNLLEQLSPQRVWEVLFEESEDMNVLGTNLRVLSPAARAFHLVLHAYSHAGSSAQAEADLTRALSVLPVATWRSAVVIADRLGTMDLWTSALRSDPGGEALARELDLPTRSSSELAIRSRDRSEGERWAALGVDWWLRQGLPERASLLLRKMFPSRAYLRARSRLAARGGIWLVAAYVARPFVILGWGIRGALTLFNARRETDDERS